MAKFKVLLTDYAWPDLDIERGILDENDAELVVADDTEVESLAALAADCDAIMTNWAQVPRTVIEAAGKCRIVSRLGIGLDNIDVEAATERGMVVTNVPDYCLVEVAEHTLALILALGRKVARFHLDSKSGRYDLQSGPPLRRLAGQTVGIIGMGHIGREVARRAGCFGFRVLACDVRKTDVEGVEWKEQEELLAESDFVTLHVPLLPATRHMIGAAEFERMKPTACLVNTARGGLVDHEALARSLASDEIAGAGLDVQEPEPPDLSLPPFNDPRVIVTPHAAFNSVESVTDMRTRVTRQVVERLAGRVPENVVNPSVLG